MNELLGLKGLNVVWLSKTDLTNLNAGEGESNYIDIKKYKKDGIEYPYVSGQAMRFYLKEAMRRSLEEKEYMCIPDDKGETCGEINKCLMCDLFGFMKPSKGKGAVTRVSPVKVSPAIGLLPFDENANVDFLTRRHRVSEGAKMEGDIVNIEIGTNIYKSGISIDMRRVGGEEEVKEEKRTISIKNAVESPEKIIRVKKTLDALRYLADYSKQARLLTDFSPDLIAVSVQKKYSHRLQKLFDLNNGRELNIQRLNEILSDVSEYSDTILFGMVSGIVKNEAEVKKAVEAKGIQVKTPSEVINEAKNLVK
ncbi:MAG: type I-B CRISPR-associated protein Cas7/Cst2/DevR [Candidatus Methanoperedenaceae archaeon]|nr:MAG: type I-B CRISPR-associated protein Cas7/Cst2/DevR [Candidatus Methanoperedenaceae archaeon]